MQLHLGLSRCSGNLTRLLHSIRIQRLFSSKSDNLNINVDSKTGVAVLELHRKPVNGWSVDFMSEIISNVQKLHQDKCRGLIVTSTLPNTFSGGLDLQIVTNKQRDVIRDIIARFQDLYCSIYGSPLVTIAAINGHAIAGGIVFPLAFDYRIMVRGTYKAGLVESAVHIVTPRWVNEATQRVLGERNAELALLLGQKYTADEAVKIGMVDRACEANELMPLAHEEMKRWLAVPDYSRQMIKEHLRRPFINKIQAIREEESETFAARLMTDATQTYINNMLRGLKKK